MLPRLLARIAPSKDGFGRGVATLVTGTGIAQILVIATIPIVTRLYSPADFGIYSVAVSILSMLLTVACLRYEFAIPLPQSDNVAANVLALALASAFLTAGLALIAFLLVGPWLVGVLGAPGLAPYVLLVPLAQLGGGISSAVVGWALRTKSFSTIAATKVTQGVALVGGQLGLGVLGTGAPGLLVGDVFGRITGSTRIARAAWSSHAVAFRQVTRAGMLAVAKRYRRFPIFSSGSALLAALGQQSPILTIVAFYGPVAGGEYALAAKVGAVPLSLLAGAVGQVFVAEAARLGRTRPSGVRRLFTKTTTVLALVAIGPAIVGAIAAPIVAPALLGASWAQVGLLVAILMPSFFLEFCIGATGDVLYVLERQELHLIREVLRFALIGGAIPLAAALGLSATEAVALLAAARVVTYLAYGLVSWWAIQKGFNPMHASEVAEAVDSGLGQGWTDDGLPS